LTAPYDIRLVFKLMDTGSAMKRFNKVLYASTALVIITISLIGFFLSVTKDKTEKELVSFMLDFIVQQEIGGTVNYIQSSGQPWVDAPPDANMIVWAPPDKDRAEYTINYLKSGEPIKVWWFADNQLIETAKKKESIQKYQETHMSDPESNIWAWGYYEFGVLSVSLDNREATIYVGVSCGPVCGHGVIYAVHRNNSGKWEINDSKDIWIS
jgi:hypothetical protein